MSVDHVWIDTVDEEGHVSAKGARDSALDDAARFTVYRVRFQVVNAGDTAVDVSPTLEVLRGTAWSAVPEVDPVDGQPFYAASDAGRTYKVRETEIAAGDLRLDTAADGSLVAVPGTSSAGINPPARLALPARSFTEVEFAFRATVDAAWLGSYDLRLSDGGHAIASTVDTTITMGARPKLQLSPGQQSGEKVDEPQPLFKLNLTGVDTAGNRLALSATTAGLVRPFAGPSSFVSPHTNYSLTSDFCTACHATHVAQGPLLATAVAPQSNLCFTCHDGSGADANVKAQWTSTSLPANDPSTASWYSHPATSASTHVTDKQDEFGGISNRHAACADCHQPHLSDATRPVVTTGGWTAAGAIAGASGVAVTNGAAGTAPVYELKTTSAFEYELCLKCHSGFTQLNAQDPAHPSRWALDKGIELNPANVSFHPIQAKGRNQTNAMALSLTGDAPGKLWQFTPESTIRCANCHATPAAAAGTPAADAPLDTHTSANRGILLANYRDRDLRPRYDLYEPTDFSLCYLCHAEAPMVDESGTVRYDTNFSMHGRHLQSLWAKGTGGTDIDTPGAGQGNASCAECHFRIHGTALVNNGPADKGGLVGFSPNVLPYNGSNVSLQGKLEFTQAVGSTRGSCTLTCHGKAHAALGYDPAP